MAGYVGILKALRKISGQIDSRPPRELSRQLGEFAEHWLHDHAVLFDARLVQFGEGEGAKMDFDSELVAMLDEHVFPNRPTRSMARLNATKASRGRKLEVRGRFESLSPAQRNVFWLVVQGKTSREISRALGISINTVKTHRAVIFAKMEVNSVIELLKKADVLRRD